VASSLDSVVLDEAVEDTAQRGGQRRHADAPVGGVGDHDHVGGDLVAMLDEQPFERLGAELLLTLDEDHDADR
jgi:hypothetical protein